MKTTPSTVSSHKKTMPPQAGRRVALRAKRATGRATKNAAAHLYKRAKKTMRSRRAAAAAQPDYDSGVRYDTPGLRYAVADPAPTPPNDGGKVALGLTGRPDADLLGFTDNHIALIGSDPLFAGVTLMPAAAEFLALRNDFATALATFNAAKDAFHSATQAKDAARTALEAGFNVRGPFVQSVANFNKAAILATGLPLKAGRTPMPPLQPPQNLRVDLNGTPGVMFASWLAEARARGYLIQWSLADTPERNWSEPLNSTNRKVSFTGMQIGKLHAFRVASLGPDSKQSDWSQEVLRMAA